MCRCRQVQTVLAPALRPNRFISSVSGAGLVLLQCSWLEAGYHLFPVLKVEKYLAPVWIGIAMEKARVDGYLWLIFHGSDRGVNDCVRATWDNICMHCVDMHSGCIGLRTDIAAENRYLRASKELFGFRAS